MPSRSTHRPVDPELTPLRQRCSRAVARWGAWRSTLGLSTVVSLLSLVLTYGYIRALGYDTMGEAFYISLLVPLPMTLLTGWAIFSLIVALEQSRHAAHVQSITDSLTGLANRRHLVYTAQNAIDLALHRQEPLALLILDIDHFKRVNDTHGHHAGDKVLVEVARRCAQCLRPTDLLARWGGEEFVVLLPNTPLEHARQLAERMREAVAFSAQLYTPSDAVRVTISMGAAGMAAGEPMTLDALVQAADNALYDAKRAGRNQVSLAPSGLSRFGPLLAT